MKAFRDKVVLVTGGASGIGRAICQQMAAVGAKVVLSDLNGEGAQALAEELTAAGHTASASALDVSDADAVTAWIDGAAKAHGRIDVLVNNAGIGLVGEAHEQTLDDWNQVLDVNVRGVVHGVLAAYPRMVRQGHGHIVNIASLAGLAPSPHFTVYSASKHAVVGLSTSLRAEGRDLGVKVTAVCPGFVKTAIITDAKVTSFDRQGAMQEALRLASTPEQCARAILKGVAKNKPIVVVTGHGRFLAWMWRHFPWVVWLITKNAARNTRRHKLPPA